MSHRKHPYLLQLTPAAEKTTPYCNTFCLAISLSLKNKCPNRIKPKWHKKAIKNAISRFLSREGSYFLIKDLIITQGVTMVSTISVILLEPCSVKI